LAGKRIGRIFLRWSEAWREALASALGAALSWFLAERLLGHPQPIFAAISAIVCLSPGLPSHTKQTGGLLLGVATGIVIGELTTALSDNIPLLAAEDQLGGFSGNDCRSLLRAVGSGSHPSGRVGDAGRGVRIGHDQIPSNGRCGRRCGCRFPVQPSSFCSRSKTQRPTDRNWLPKTRHGASFSATGTDCRKREPFAASDALPRVGLPIFLET